MSEWSDDAVLWEAEFNPKVRTYWLLSGALIMAVTLVGIPLLLPWFVFGHMLTERYLRYMSCTLTESSLQFSKGMFVRVEKTVPLDKITDVALVHGPIMRALDLQAISIETAGQSSTGALIKIIGVVNTEAFREAILLQRDKLVRSDKKSLVAESSAVSAEHTLAPQSGMTHSVLEEIRDSLHRIEGQMRTESSE